MKFTAYITVRLNSKRVPQKSIKTLDGDPLVNICVDKVTGISEISDTLLYCSDESIVDYINPRLDYTFLKRDTKFDGDYVTFNDILDSVIDEIDTDYIVFFSVTSPFVKQSTIVDMIEKVKSNQYDSAFLAYEVNNFSWYDGSPLNYSMSSDVSRTQDLKPIIVENSGLYIFSKDMYKKHKRRIGFNPYIKIVDMLEAWDIDTPSDFKIAKHLANDKH